MFLKKLGSVEKEWLKGLLPKCAIGFFTEGVSIV